MKVLITGGCGFIGSNFINYLLNEKEVGEDIKILNLDKISYAGSGGNLEYAGLVNNKNYRFFRGDICDKNFVGSLISHEKPDLIFNFAAESHVDRSISDSDIFENTNFFGALNVFKSALKNNTKKIVQISTDEVYGSAENGSFSEESNLNPSSPYSATKAATDLNTLAYFKTYKLPIIITRSANNFGPYQFPEKILPLFITNLIEGKKVPLMWSEENPGLNVRDWLHVTDNCRAIWLASQKRGDGEIYNIPGENEKTNVHTTYILLKHFGFDESMIEKVPHRKAHDFRYSISGEKIKKLGFKHEHKDFESEIKKTVEWYKKNQNWWRELKN